MRRKIKRKIKIQPDFLYDSTIVEKFTNYIMKAGKKSIARKIMYGMLEDVKKKTKAENPVDILELAIKNASPLVEVRSRRVGGANYQVPREVRPERRFALACRWILEAARAKKGEMVKNLSEEIISASKNEGSAIKKRENVHKMAEANKAFAHFAW